MKILLVEDDKMQAKQMKQLIENHFKGSCITVAHTLDKAKEALDKVKKALDRDPFDVLLLDLVLNEDGDHLRLPDIGEYGGSQVLGHARDGGSQALAFLLTASSIIDKEFLLEFTDRYSPLDIIVKNMVYDKVQYQDIVVFKLKVAENLLKKRRKFFEGKRIKTECRLLIVDDNKSFLDQLEMIIDREHKPYAEEKGIALSIEKAYSPEDLEKTWRKNL